MDSLMVLTMPESAVHAPSSAVIAGRSYDGQGARDDSSAALRDAITTLRGGADVQVCPIAMPGDLDGALHRRGSRTIVIAGGDAGLHSVVSALHRRNELDDAILAMIPAGPAGATSAFARGAGIPTTPEVAAQVILAGHERRFDMLMDCRGEVVVNGATVLGRPDRRSRALTGLGSMSGVGAFGDLASRPLRVQVVADDEVITDLDRPVLGVQVNNCPPEELPAGSDVDPCDGYADVVVTLASGGLRRVRRALGARRMARATPPMPVGSPGAPGLPDTSGPAGLPGHGASVEPAVAGRSAGAAGSTEGLSSVGTVGSPDVPAPGRSIDPMGSMNPAARLAVHQAAYADVLRLRARTVSVAGQWFALTSDGENAGAEQRCTWSVLPERLRVIAPVA